jgi:GT2 family glycosyltransferase
MASRHEGGGLKPILAILVLYKMSFSASPSFRALQSALREDSQLAALIDLLVVDNTPDAQSLPAEFAAHYLHDGQNPGLAARYNLALQRAAIQGHAWLLLLDQDTELTLEYLQELMALSQQLAVNQEIVAIAPKLITSGRLLSPHLPPYLKSQYPLDLSTYGVYGGLLRVFNSGALVRVSALQAIGGFPVTYPLDYLDHATFAQLQKRGGRIFLMNARLEHDASANHPEKHKSPGHAARHPQQLAAELRFYREHGTLQARLRHRWGLARQASRSLRHLHYAEAGRLLRAILSWPGAR